ncbi:MAG: ectonucleotide pyrophosphatase/phosphodiesterase [Pyrinomonadaceae bacterium]|nr:ectonucleotide pyrophosphatase/phosphodiesterase [Pyrinomonadaceae bacterium]MCX7639257.1 ectonucleotide pyrophosphatase/phosphodiesterase [Pyrinomonadaceae bacterium]MDW8303521.1 ectonucleotide pyrophosphatase/phosphodiesterase [Acidobacteriota bacterium]
MSKIIKSLLLIILLTSFSLAQIKDLKPTVILVSLDGFRADYIEKYKPPTLLEIARRGVRAKWLVPVFPTKTFPNHYSIATGLYPENHGIIENNIYDFGTIFSLNKREEVQNGRWWLGEPIWVTAEKQGIKTAAFFFPGTEAEIKGIRPTFWKTYDEKVPYEERVATILSWLDLPVEKRPQLLILYFDEPDSSGHRCGPNSDCVANAIKRVDLQLRNLVNGLKERKVYGKVNLIIVSDHGMAEVKPNQVIFLDDYLDQNLTERILWTGEIVQIFPKEGKKEKIAENLKSIANAKCWKKEEIPSRFRYQASPRIAPIICLADEGWFMTSRERYESQKNRPEYNQIRGAHGYDNQLASMRAIFIAQGKAFKKGKIVEPFENVDIYNILATILGLKPAQTDGNLNTLRKVLR